MLMLELKMKIQKLHMARITQNKQKTNTLFFFWSVKTKHQIKFERMSIQNTNINNNDINNNINNTNDINKSNYF